MTLRLEPAAIRQSKPPLEPGDAVGSRYRLDCMLGTSGHVTTWRAADEVLERQVTIRATADVAGRFFDQARAIAGLWHPNLVQIFDFGQADGLAYLVSEYLAGGDLKDRLDRTEMNREELRRLAGDLLSALAYLHSRGLVHGAVDAGHVLLDEDGRAHLNCFGATAGGPGTCPDGDLVALGELLACAPRARLEDPALDDLIDALLDASEATRSVTAYEALEALQVCAAPAGRETQEFDVLAALDEDLAPSRVGPSAGRRATARTRSRWAPKRVLVAIGLQPLS